MDERLRRMKRVAVVQEQMHRLAEQRLTRLVSEEKELRANEVALVTALDEATLLHGFFVEQMAKRVRRIAGQANETARQAELQREKLLEEKRKLKQVEEAAKRLERDYLRLMERKRLEETVRPVRRIGDASLP
ncbi:hypothetical protein [Amorphus sp. 3PC139-8]|uniref:hypothetical protein n=1 Tax=Amorphus sp. 3PC139-8 TaxID=2735676 RepID=UPI00345CDD1A